jgi:hypothetical protein
MACLCVVSPPVGAECYLLEWPHDPPVACASLSAAATTCHESRGAATGASIPEAPKARSVSRWWPSYKSRNDYWYGVGYAECASHTEWQRYASLPDPFPSLTFPDETP